MRLYGKQARPSIGPLKAQPRRRVVQISIHQQPAKCSQSNRCSSGFWVAPREAIPVSALLLPLCPMELLASYRTASERVEWPRMRPYSGVWAATCKLITRAISRFQSSCNLLLAAAGQAHFAPPPARACWIGHCEALVARNGSRIGHHTLPLCCPARARVSLALHYNVRTKLFGALKVSCLFTRNFLHHFLLVIFW